LSHGAPEAAVYTVEPEGFDDTARSLASGEITGNVPGAQSFCDALLAPRPGDMTFALNRRLGVRGLAVSDAEVRAAMRFAYSWMKLVVEPGGAVCLAAVLSGKLPVEGRTVSIVLSGANVDPATFCRSIAGE
jgi:threonine dehydratase